MSRDQGLGGLLLVGSVVGIVLYGWLVFLSRWSYVVLQLTGFIVLAGVLGIVGWIGYTLAITPPLKVIEDAESYNVEKV